MVLVLLANFAATWFMVGLIWFVQLVHYPQFAGVGSDAFVAYHRRHTRFTTYVVAGPMIAEGITAVLLAARPGAAGVSPVIAWAGLGLLVVIWFSTALLQVPRHNELSGGFDVRAGTRLCRTNWLRTTAWTARGVLMTVALAAMLSRA
jgi:hypothetical protein